MARRSDNVIDFFVAVPTYDRAESIESKTLALLSRHGVPADRIYIFVASEAERKLYANKLGSAWPHIIVGVPTLWQQRNFITNFFKEDAHVVSLDDDVEELYRLVGEPLNGGHLEIIHDGGLVDIIRDAWLKMETYGTYMWSLNVSDNPGFMKANRCTLRHGLCNGFIWGCRLRKTPALTLRYGDGHEDVERTLRYIHLDGFVFRYREFCAKTHCKTNSGGLQKSMAPGERIAEEKRCIERLIAEFPHLVEMNQRSKIGVKFLTPTTLLRRYSMMTSSQFQQYAALKQLSLMIGCHCVCRDAVGRFLSCKIEQVKQDIGAIGLVLSSGQALLTSTSGFNEALMAGKIFVVLPSPEFCKAEGVMQPVDIHKLKRFLSQTNAQLAHGDAHTRPSSKGAPTTASFRNEFAQYLNSMSCCAEDDSEGEDEENEAASLKAAGASKPIGRCANVLKKKAEKFEDSAWIEQQRGALSAEIHKDNSVQGESTLDILRDWAAEDGLDVALREYTVKQGVAPTSVVNPLFCASRIWAGGWGAQCTHPRLKNEEFCKQHRKEIARQGYLTHGSYGGPIPPKKRLEFEKWQKKLQDKQGHQACNTLSDAADFSIDTWKAMSRGAGESDRAYAYRTGAIASSTKKRPAAADDCVKMAKGRKMQS